MSSCHLESRAEGAFPLCAIVAAFSSRATTQPPSYHGNTPNARERSVRLCVTNLRWGPQLRLKKRALQKTIPPEPRCSLHRSWQRHQRETSLRGGRRKKNKVSAKLKAAVKFIQRHALPEGATVQRTRRTHRGERAQRSVPIDELKTRLARPSRDRISCLRVCLDSERDRK